MHIDPTLYPIPPADEALSQEMEGDWRVSKGHPAQTVGWFVSISGSEQRRLRGCDR